MYALFTAVQLFVWWLQCPRTLKARERGLYSICVKCGNVEGKREIAGSTILGGVSGRGRVLWLGSEVKGSVFVFGYDVQIGGRMLEDDGLDFLLVAGGCLCAGIIV